MIGVSDNSEGARAQRVEPVDGDADAPLYRYDQYDLALLERDLEAACAGWDWSEGVFGHALSLPAPEQLCEPARRHYNNLPFANRLASCPYFQSILDSFECDVMSLRLLRRPPNSLYGLHTDHDKGERTVRMQIPIRSPHDAFMVVTTYADMRELPDTEATRRLSGSATISGSRQKLTRWLDDLVADSEGRINLYQLDVGWSYLFDTDNVHTLANLGMSERVVLAIDCVANDWLLARYPEIASLI
ncbi:hypothetical protein ENSA5_54060 [Enhygromyxa salina]|uniref:Aspartyl/Asparaginyl beta-hydroxylase n=1 Tax=Enhygromyxa salina TaxID=215803 RepID=A0A2S9XFK5_9BACT|nr:hypothetical protein [Enhygromyxa salina]PRP91646.1 hypothetical protein ENSA5_54060 [Enhygromyxa salina]